MYQKFMHFLLLPVGAAGEVPSEMAEPDGNLFQAGGVGNSLALGVGVFSTLAVNAVRNIGANFLGSGGGEVAEAAGEAVGGGVANLAAPAVAVGEAVGGGVASLAAPAVAAATGSVGRPFVPEPLSNRSVGKEAISASCAGYVSGICGATHGPAGDAASCGAALLGAGAVGGFCAV